MHQIVEFIAAQASLAWSYIWRSRYPELPPLNDTSDISDVLKSEPALPKSSKPRPRREVDQIFEFSFKGDILDDLENYFMLLGRMRKGDRESYDLYSRVGAQLLPWHQFGSYDARSVRKFDGKVLPWFMQTRPGFGAVMWTKPSEDEEIDGKKWVWPRFMIFQKYALRSVPSNIQPVNSGTVYCVSAYWDSNFTEDKRGYGTQFGVCLEPDGSVRVLRMLMSKHYSIRHRHGKNKGGVTTFTRREWGLPEFFQLWAKDHNMTVDEVLTEVFVAAANAYEISHYGMIKVTVRKGKVVAAFNIAAKRSAYFFKDREVHLNDKGSRKRIFHIVRPHERVTNGGTTTVRMHFRGERRFGWNGYDVLVTVPGKHHIDWSEFDVGCLDEDKILFEGGQAMDMAQLGDYVSGNINDGGLGKLGGRAVGSNVD